MADNNTADQIPGVSREEEAGQLARILDIAQRNLKRTEESVRQLAGQLHELQEVYDLEDKEGQAQWFNTDARYRQVSQDLLRAQRSRKKPYFGRIDFTDSELGRPECYYIGRSVIAEDAAKPVVIDWRAPVASVYYEKSPGLCSYSVEGEGAYEIDLQRKRTYEIEEDQLKDFYDSDVVANDELLTKYLARNKRTVLNEIIATIQQEQNEIIRKDPHHNMIVQGAAGSGKTTVAMHRISYILYNYELEFKPKDFYIIGSNRILLNYITGILPDLDVYGVSQMTMEQLFIRLLYEDWDAKKYHVKPAGRKGGAACIKSGLAWFRDLEAFCTRYEWNQIPREDIYTPKTHRLLMRGNEIEKLLKRFESLSLPDKLEKLTEHLMSKLENEIYGRQYSYPPEEQKRLIRHYQTYFGKREWKGSVFELYDSFLEEQNARGSKVTLPGTEYDLYDLAALSYLYKRIKETEVIQEASHVVIDEAQDFGMMVYGALQYCLSKCTYTIMGDVSQNISFDDGLPDWEELQSLMLPDEFDFFGILRKSYRNTVEISDFALRILQHGSFPVYPVEPIIRHGAGVEVRECADDRQLISETVRIVSQWKEKGYETIAVICREEAEAAKVTEELAEKMKVRELNAETEGFGGGVMVLPVRYAKGLEFDAVLLFNADTHHYPAEDGHARLLYVAATRALHELAVLYTGRLTDLIAADVPEERKQKILAVQPGRQTSPMQEKEQKTNREKELEQAKEGHREMELRSRIGPRRIVVPKPGEHKDGESGQQERMQKKRSVTVSGRKTDYYAAALGREPAGKPAAGRKGAGSVNSAAVCPETEGKIPAAVREGTDTGKAGRNGKKPENAAGRSEFGEMPDTARLRPAGHAKCNLNVRWMAGSQSCLELTNSYGVLRITPVAEETVRISFAREPFTGLADVPEELQSGRSFRWSYRETREKAELKTEKLLVQADRKTGALSFYTAKGRLLLSENSLFPRQIEKLPVGRTWTYFDWAKKEQLKARGASEREWLDLNGSARYISHGTENGQAACIQSDRGYQILIPADRRAMCCMIPAYGLYVSTEGEEQIDYYFRTAL